MQFTLSKPLPTRASLARATSRARMTCTAVKARASRSAPCCARRARPARVGILSLAALRRDRPRTSDALCSPQIGDSLPDVTVQEGSANFGEVAKASATGREGKRASLARRLLPALPLSHDAAAPLEESFRDAVGGWHQRPMPREGTLMPRTTLLTRSPADPHPLSLRREARHPFRSAWRVHADLLQVAPAQLHRAVGCAEGGGP